jgi:outer membrane receptor for ferrienterochelin and colicins
LSVKNILIFFLAFFLAIHSIAQKKDSLLKRKINTGEVVISGKMKEMRKIDSPIPIESYQAHFFKKSAVNNLLDATQQITGLRPQINCSVCNTGDIHMNGMEGAYTAILIDGMPIVSSLSSIYGLSGIPLSMIERVEVIKGPATALYGSQAMAGVINIITKKTNSGDVLSLETNVSNMQEYNNEVAFRWKVRKNISALSSISLLNYNKPYDVNEDGFTDIALQNRISVFNKIKIGNGNYPYQIGLRLFNENRWGGELNWTDRWSGSDTIYGESIETNRIELIQSWLLPLSVPVEIQSSYVYHQQQSIYGQTRFDATQHTGFLQGIYRHQQHKNEYEIGASIKYQHYDDNTILTRKSEDTLFTQAQVDMMPGVFIQQERAWNKQWKTLAAWRTDLQKNHGLIHSPRLSIQFKKSEQTQYRLGMGRGFRVVNVFTEDHAALTGDRKIKIAEVLNPESSLNTFFSIDHFSLLTKATLKTEFHFFYSYFYNRIQANYDIDPNLIVYKNLDGNVISRGANLRFDLQTESNWNLQVGFTFLDAFENRRDSIQNKVPLMFSSRLNTNVNLSYDLPKLKTKMDYQVVGYSPMRLPILPNDFRPEYSDWYFIHQVQITNTSIKNLEVYVSVKNIFNFLPLDPIMRANDPFDKNVNVNNPNNYTFDTTYGYAPMQGRRVLVGLRLHLAKVG